MSEHDYWRALALYLADCHAATAEGLPKSTSKSERKRMENLCSIAADAIFSGSSTAPLSLYWHCRGDKRVLARLRECAAGARYTITEAGKAYLEGKK